MMAINILLWDKWPKCLSKKNPDSEPLF